MTSSTSLPMGGETRLGPFFFTFRPQPGSEAITIPAFLVPLQWPPTEQSTTRAAPYSSFVYTEFAPSPVHPVWSVSSDCVAQWTGAAPPTPDPSPHCPPQDLPPSHGPSSLDVRLPGSGDEPPLQVPQDSLPPPTGDDNEQEPCSQAVEHSREGAYSTRPSSDLGLDSAGDDDEGGTPRKVDTCTTVPSIAISRGTDSATPSPPNIPSLPSSSYQLATAPPTRVQSVNTSTATDTSLSRTLCNSDYEVPQKKTARKSIPDEWTKQQARPSTPFEVVDIDDAPVSPTLERPTSAASVNPYVRPSCVTDGRSPTPSLRRRPTVLLRPESQSRPASCSPRLSHDDLKAPSLPSVLRTKSMSALRLTSGE